MLNIKLNEHSAEDAKDIEKLKAMGVPEDVIQMGYDNTQKSRTGNLDMSRSSVAGLDRTGQVDKISLANAVETPFWMVVWATEPQRKISVEMSYDDLKIICDLIDREREQNICNRIEEVKNNDLAEV